MPIGVCATINVGVGVVAVDVGITVHIGGIVHVDVAIDVHVRVIVSTPATPVSPVAIVCNDRARGHAKPEGDSGRRHRVIRWGNISWIRGRITGINDRGIILRNIDHVRLRGLNLHNLISYIDRHLFHYVRDDRIGHRHHLLLSRFERAAPLSLGPHPLDCIRHPFRLIDECVPKVARPLNVVVHLIYHIGKLRHRLDIVVPRLRIQFRDIVRVFHEPRRLHKLQRIRRCWQHGGEQRIRIKRNGRYQFVQVGIALFCRR